MRTERKALVRRELRERRVQIAQGRDLALDGLRIRDRVLDGPARALPAGATVTLYESFGAEPVTGPLLAGLHEAALRVLLPITLPDLDLDWFDAADPDRTPLGLDAIERVALALIPGLSVDTGGTRLGQGGGCYDRALPRMPQTTYRIVLLHPGEVLTVSVLPRQDHDEVVDAAVTAEALTWLGERPGCRPTK
ncbi:MAG: 5-formyltetrahydrofolate cyclo-ligase [Nostocoides sp.]